MPSNFFFTLKKNNFLTKMAKNIVFFTNIGIFCFNYVISMLWEIFWGALHVCMSKIWRYWNLFHNLLIFEFPQPRGCFWRGYATQEADQEPKWKLMTLSVWKIWVLEFLGPQSSHWPDFHWNVSKPWIQRIYSSENYAIVAIQCDNVTFLSFKIIKVTSGFNLKKTIFFTRWRQHLKNSWNIFKIQITPLLWRFQDPQGCLKKGNCPLSLNLAVWCAKIGPKS